MITFDDHTEVYMGKLITISITHHHGGRRLVTGCIGIKIEIREESTRSKEEIIADMQQRVRELQLHLQPIRAA